MYLKSSQSNQSYPYLPLINAADETNLQLPLPMPLSTVQALSLINLSTEYEYDDQPPMLSASFIPENSLQFHYKQMRQNRSTNLIDKLPYPPSSQPQPQPQPQSRPSSSKYKRRSSSDMPKKGYQHIKSISGDALNMVNVSEIGWKIPVKTSHGNAREKIDAIKARKNIPTSLKIIKSSVPVHSHSTLSIPNQRSFDEQTFRHSTHSLLVPQIQSLYNRKSIRKAFMKSRSFNSFENQSHSGYHSDNAGVESSHKSVQTIETELQKCSTIQMNRNILSLDIVKSFNEDDLKKIIDSNTDSGVLDTSDTSVERMSGSRRKSYETKNLRNLKNLREIKDAKVVSEMTGSINLKLPDAQTSVKTPIKSPMRTPIRTPVRTPILPSNQTTVSVVQSKPQPDLKVAISPDLLRKLSRELSPITPVKNTTGVLEEKKEDINMPKYKQYSEFDVSKSDASFTEKLNLEQKPRVRRYRKLSQRNSERRKKEQKTNVDENQKQKSQTTLKRVSSVPDEDDDNDVKVENQSDESGSDEVFEPPVFEKVPQRTNQRRSSSLEDLSLFQAKKLLEKDLERGRSSVSINEIPEYFEYNRKSFGRGAKAHGSYPSIANRALYSSQKNKPNGIASLQMSPKRGLLKKPSSAIVNDVPSNSSEYDVRDRGNISAVTNNRGQPSLSSNNRELYRDRGDREPSRSLSDRDPREQDSFNRSLSTTEGTPDDKIGMLTL